MGSRDETEREVTLPSVRTGCILTDGSVVHGFASSLNYVIYFGYVVIKSKSCLFNQ